MATTIQNQNLPKAYLNETYDDVFFNIDYNGAPVDLTGCEAILQVTANDTIIKEYLLDVDDDDLEIVGDGKIKLKQHLMAIAVGSYRYNLQITLSDNTVRTYYTGTLVVAQTIIPTV